MTDQIPDPPPTNGRDRLRELLDADPDDVEVAAEGSNADTLWDQDEDLPEDPDEGIDEGIDAPASRRMPPGGVPPGGVPPGGMPPTAERADSAPVPGSGAEAAPSTPPLLRPLPTTPQPATPLPEAPLQQPSALVQAPTLAID